MTKSQVTNTLGNVFYDEFVNMSQYKFNLFVFCFCVCYIFAITFEIEVMEFSVL